METKEKNSYCVLKFNFSSLNTNSKERLEEEFSNKIKQGLDVFMYRYGCDFEYLKEGSAAGRFESFINKASQHINAPMYVIIDEYDYFANELLSFKLDMFSEIISQTGFVRKFFEALKIGTESIVKRIFATGVSPITLDSLTSGFNIASDMTRDQRFNEVMGFTEDEVRVLVINANSTLKETEVDLIIDEMRQNYNGYLFTQDGNRIVFNSDMVLYYLKYYEDDFKSLLFYLGLLTIEREDLGDVVLKVPNNVIKELYFDFFGKKIAEEIDYELNTSQIRGL